MSQQAGKRSGYEELIQLFREFRDYQEPPAPGGVHDYSPETMREQELRLPEFRRRLDAIDTAGWTVPQMVDLAIVRTELNGLEFDHKVLRPWERDPSFYSVIEVAESDVPAREAPRMHGTLQLFKCTFPLSEAQEVEVREKLAAVPGILAQAKNNLTANTKELHYLGILEKQSEVKSLNDLSGRLKDTHPELASLAQRAGEAADDFRKWLEARHAAMADSYDGIGVEEFDWSMKHVHLVPYTWAEQREMIQRELDRSWTALKLEEHRNRHLPKLAPPAMVEEMQKRVDAVYPEYMSFLRDGDVFTVPDYMHLGGGRVSGLAPVEHRDIFTQVDYHNMLPLRCHMIHWLEKQREEHNTHPLRKEPLLYNIWDSRAEGFATAFEETMLQAGMMDNLPRARELVYILLAFRAARAMGDLLMHSREWNLQDAITYSVAGTPRGWLKADGYTALLDLALYLRQPGYGTSYVVGKIQFERLISDVAMQAGDGFTLKGFLDDYFSRGMVPASLIRWEMTGREDEMRKLGVI